MTEEHEKALVDYNITQTVYDLAVAQELSAAALQENKVAKVHLAVDTGMNRIGCVLKKRPILLRHQQAAPCGA